MDKKITFDKAIDRLTEIINKIESGETSLEETVTLYEEGSRLATHCYAVLDSAEQKLTTIDEAEGSL